jgi:anti-sigma factor RsiW
MMHDCEDGALRDLLPEYVHGTLSDAERDAVSDHLEACEDCAAEVELIRTASTAFTAPTIDVSAVVKALPRAPREARRRVMDGQVYRVAAGLGVIAIGALSVIALRGVFNKSAAPVAQSASAPPSVSANPAPAAAPPSQIAAIPESVTRSPASAPKRAQSISFGGGLSDLSDEQLGALLGELDGLESLPAEEPETHVVNIVPPGEGGQGAR